MEINFPKLNNNKKLKLIKEAKKKQNFLMQTK